MKTYIHVNQHVIKSNLKNGENKPAITVKTSKSNTYCHKAIVKGEVEVIQEWRSKMYGMKTGLIAVGFLIVHLVVIVGALTGINWNNR